MNPKIANEIIHRHQGGQSIRGIAADLAISRRRVTRIIRLQRQARQEESITPELPRPAKPRGSKLDRFEEMIQRLLGRYPQITVTRLLEELRREGYRGAYTILRERVKQLRASPTKPLVVRFETSPGTHYGKRGAMFSNYRRREPRCYMPAGFFT